MKPTPSTQPTNPKSQRLVWLIAGGAFIAILCSAFYLMDNEPKHQVLAPPTNPDGTPLTPVLIGAPLVPSPKDVGQLEVVELNGQQVVKFRVNSQGDEVVFDSITGKVVFIRTKDGVVPTNEFPTPPVKEMAPEPKAGDPTMKTWFQAAPM